MSRIPQDAPANHPETETDRVNRYESGLPDGGRVESDEDADADEEAGFEPSDPADVGLEPRTPADERSGDGQSVAEKFDIDEKHLHHPPSDD